MIASKRYQKCFPKSDNDARRGEKAEQEVGPEPRSKANPWVLVCSSKYKRDVNLGSIRRRLLHPHSIYYSGQTGVRITVASQPPESLIFGHFSIPPRVFHTPRGPFCNFPRSNASAFSSMAEFNLPPTSCATSDTADRVAADGHLTNMKLWVKLPPKGKLRGEIDCDWWDYIFSFFDVFFFGMGIDASPKVTSPLATGRLKWRICLGC